MAQPDLVLIVEDEEFVRDSLVEVLRVHGIQALTAESVDRAETLLAQESVSVVLTDLRMPGRDGLELLRGMEGSSTPVIMLTGHGTVDEAVAAMKAGAYDFVQKPVDAEQLILVLRRAQEHGRLLDEVQRLRNAMAQQREERALAGTSAPMAQVRRLIEQVGPTDATVLVTGESGTGKELVAAGIHAKSGRVQGPLVQVNCAAIPESLFESEFFGHRRGAFSGAHADRDGRLAEAEGGTLVLDEIETLAPDVQAKLLRVLENGEYQVVGDSRTRKMDVRIIAVSNEDLAARVEAGDFRRDLYYRLNVFPIEMPPLRDHLEDVGEIAQELFARIQARIGTPAPSLGEEALAELRSYTWPGNVRELRNVLERATILQGQGQPIEADLLRTILKGASASSKSLDDLDLRSRSEALERELVREALLRADGSKKEAARLLGIDPKNLSYYLRKHNLQGESAAG